MRKVLLAVAAVVALVSVLSIAPNRAEAAALPITTGIQAALEDNDLLQEAAYVCRRVWRCGAYGCAWRRVCSYTRPYYRPYRSYRYYRRW
jgi:hypothetical protein